MDFLNFVKKGIEKSNKCLEAISEVNDIFNKINTDLKKFPAGELKLNRTISTRSQLEAFAEFVAGIDSNYLKNDRIVLSLKTKDGIFTEDVAGWKQRATGYPCILKFDGQELSCGNSAHLITGLTELLESVGFGNAVNSLTRKASAPPNPKESSAAETGTHLSLVSQPIGKPAKSNEKAVIAKAIVRSPNNASAKSVAAKAAVKKTDVRSNAKPSGAKDGAMKHDSKLVAKKPAAKSTVKSRGVKTQAKNPSPKSLPKKPNAKARAKSGVAKPIVEPAPTDTETGNASREYWQNENSNQS